MLLEGFDDEYSRKDFVGLAKGFGVDVPKLLAAAAPRGEEVPKCRVCGCTEDQACKGGCGWTQMPDPKTGLGLCSGCASKAALRKVKKAKRTA